MGVYIKGMEMPDSCPCELVGIGYDLYCSFVGDSPKRAEEYFECCRRRTRPDWCPIVEVPPHGRLIDEKAVIDHFVSLANNEWNQNVSTSWANAFAEAASDICDIPTIIEAEE